MPSAKTLKDVLAEEHASIKGGEIKQASVEDVHLIRNKSDYVALCLSGGGIRSATFNLGLLQGLAQKCKLNAFDYLSTVSGGGFIGSWYSAWVYRDRKRTNDLNEPLSALSRVQAVDSFHVEPKPVEHLRSFSNYLSPIIGLLSADFWTLVAVYLRNLFLINIVLIPIVLAVLMLPRIFYAWMNYSPSNSAVDEVGMFLILVIGLAAGFYGARTVAQNLPQIRTRNDDEPTFLKRCLMPLTLCALCLVTLWGWFSREMKPDSPQLFLWLAGHELASVVLVAVVLLLLPFLITVRFKSIRALALVVAATALTVALAYACSSHTRLSDTRLYVTFAFPALFVLMMVTGTLVAGFTSRFTTDSDEEWWARCGAWMMIVVVAWIALCDLVLWIPEVVLNVMKDVSANRSSLLATWTNIGVAAGPVVGVLSAVLSIAGGFSSATPANEQEQARGGIKAWLITKATSLFACVALIFILATLATLSGPLLVLSMRLLFTLRGRVPGLTSLTASPASPVGVTWWDHLGILNNSSVPGLIVALLLVLAAARLSATFIDTNKFSLHYFWRNRIVRAYMGASRCRGTSATEIAFTQFDPADNLSMKDLRGQRPFHIVNIALNLAGSRKLNWQERLAESFTVSPLHCGTSWLGYRDSAEYAGGGGDGISLGTAVAISGAAASPNMGYMMSSPVVRFLMTMFNVRLGAWMGNPGPAGARTYKQHYPHNVLRPILSEALGQTNDESPYVYLSDGGHFENLGLYEMVLRRCRFVVVSDASTDTGYTYESLAHAIRKIRIDLGIPIEFRSFPLLGRKEDGAGVYCAVGEIGYSQVDPRCENGCLIYIKPSLKGDEPRDVINYLKQCKDFPQESISDQFFSESQFESYRMLGWLIANRLFDGADLQADFSALSGAATVVTSKMVVTFS